MNTCRRRGSNDLFTISWKGQSPLNGVDSIEKEKEREREREREDKKTVTDLCQTVDDDDDVHGSVAAAAVAAASDER